jgi:uncharacterized protein HemX
MRHSHESEVQMSTTPSHKRLDLGDSLPFEPSNEERPHIDPADVDQFTDVTTLGKRTWLTYACFLIAVGIGVAVTLAWQSYSDAARETIARAAALKAISADLDAVRQSVDRISNNVATSQEQMTHSVDQLAAHVATGQEQITREITALQTVERQIFDKVSTGPASATTPKPVLRSSRASTALTPARNP